MTVIDLVGLKAEIRFKAGFLPQIDPQDPMVQIRLGNHTVFAILTPKAAKRLATHPGPAALCGRRVDNGGLLWLDSAGVRFFDPKPAPEVPPLGGTSKAEPPLAHKFNRDLSQPPLGSSY